MKQAFLAILLTLSPVMSMAQDALPPKPKAEFAERSFDYGTVAEGAKVSHDFTIKNVGTGILAIQSMVPACGCTTAVAGKENLQPGETSTIKVDFDTTGFSGYKEKTVRLFLNDSDEMSSVLSLKGTVTPEVEVSPSNVAFGEVSRAGIASASAKEVTVILKNGKGAITGASTYSKFIKVKDLGGAGASRKFSISLDPETPKGEFRDRVVVAMTGATREYANIPVSASVSSDITLSPKTLSFGIIEGQENIVRSVRLENLGDKDIEIRSIKPNHPSISTEIKTIKPGRIFVVQVTVNPAKVSSDLRASLDILTSSQEEPSSAVNVFGILPPKV